MYKRFWIVAGVIVVGFGGLCVLGLYSLKWQEQGVRYRRNSEYIAVAEQIRRDVKGKLDDNLEAACAVVEVDSPCDKGLASIDDDVREGACDCVCFLGECDG